MHGEAIHGDLGMVKSDDLVVAISNSGESQELSTILPLFKRLGAPVIAMTGQPGFDAGAPCRHRAGLQCRQGGLPAESGPHRQFHRTTCHGRRAGVVLLDARGFKAEDFARSHPGGALGRKLLTLVRDVMRTGDAVPRIGSNASLSDMMREMSAKGLGAVAIVDAQHTSRVSSPMVTCAGWSRRARTCAHHGAREVMHPQPRTVAAHALAVDAAQLMEQHRITSVLVVDAAGRVVWCAQQQRSDAGKGDLMKAQLQHPPELLLKAQGHRGRVLRCGRCPDRWGSVSVSPRRDTQAFSCAGRLRFQDVAGGGPDCGGDHGA
jgi:arabinose-5-phosphate isomerase